MILTGRELEGYKYDVKIRHIRVIDFLISEKFKNEFLTLDGGILAIEKGYAWDGSSIPGKKYIKRLTLGFIDCDRYCKKASLVHDAICQSMRGGLLDKKYKEQADGLYRDMCIQGGMGKREANFRYWGLRKFGDHKFKRKVKPRGKVFET